MSKCNAFNYSHIYLEKLRHGPVPCHELGHSGKVADRITQLNKMLPENWRIEGHWEIVETRAGKVKERVYELKRYV